MLYGFRADITPINSSLFICFEIGSDEIGADGYGEDAGSAVQITKELLGA